jgi:O-antigen/teichoic acid export membrane protein
VLIGLEHFRHEAALMFADRVLMLAGGVTALALHTGVPGIAASFVVTRLAALLVGLALAQRHVGAIALAKDMPLWRELRDQALPLGAFSLVLTVYSYVDVLLLPRFHAHPDAATWDVGIYGASYRLYEGVTYATSILWTVLTPRYAALWKTDRAAHAQLARRGAGGACLLGAAAAAVVWLVGARALLIFGPDYAEGARALRVLACGLPLVFAIWILHSIAMSAFRTSLMLAATIASFVVNVGANAWLIPLWNRDGAAVATVIGEAVAALWLIVGLRRELAGRTTQSLGNDTIS